VKAFINLPIRATLQWTFVTNFLEAKGLQTNQIIAAIDDNEVEEY
jgi:hypothetical protein